MSTNLELYTRVTGELNGKKEQIEAKAVIESFVKRGVISPTIDIIFSERHSNYMLSTPTELFKITKDVAYNYLRKAYGGKIELKKMVNLLPINILAYNPHKPKYWSLGLTDYYNTFQAPTLTQYKDTPKHNKLDVLPTIQLLLDSVFPIKEHQIYFLNWLASAFQLNKNQNTIISIGKTEGTGKGIFHELIIRYAFGGRNCATVDSDILDSQFNGELENKSFIHMNEIKNDTSKAIDKLKALITDPIYTLKVKGFTPRDEKNFFNIWIHTNRESPLEVSTEDRRLNFFPTSRTKITGKMKYDELKGNIIAERDHFIEMLCTYEFDKDMISNPLKTDIKRSIQEQQGTIEETQYKLLMSKDLQTIYARLQDAIIGTVDRQAKEAMYNTLRPFSDLDGLMKQLESAQRNKFLPSRLLNAIYRLESGEYRTSDIAIGKILTPLWGKTIGQRVKGKPTRGREYNV